MNIDVIFRIKRYFSVWMGASNTKCSCPLSVVCRPASSSRSGIALVMVLGILSVMVIMAVAFAIAMRTERVAAGNYADSVRARQLVQAGLARALDDLAVKLGTNGLMSSVGGTNYPPWDATNSYTSAYTNTSTNADVLCLLTKLTSANEATNFVPRALWSAATNADYTNTAAHHWLPIENIIYTNYLGNSYPVATNLLGRVKYLVLNCSGLLDANFAGGAAQGRGMGTNLSEIFMNSMVEFYDCGQFFANRSVDKRYETLEELDLLNRSPQVFLSFPSNFVTYSFAPPGYYTNVNIGGNTIGTISNQINLAGKYGEIGLRKAAISNGFVQAGFTPDQADILFENLRNYLDEGLTPLKDGAADFTSYVKPVPMINEILFESESDGGVGVINKVSVEVWYPFVPPPREDFKFEIAVNMSDGDSITLQTVTIPVAELSAQRLFVLGPFTASDAADHSPYTFTIQELRVLQSTDLEVDKLLGASTNPVTVGAGSKVSYQCIDPRFNWNICPAGNQWVSYAGPAVGSLGQTNACTTDYMFTHRNDHPPCDQDAAMYVAAADRPLASVGELGYLAYDTWKTVKLYGPDCQPVLDVFAIGTNTSDDYVTNTTWRGRVNPNTCNTAVLAAVFNNMPVDNCTNDASQLLLADATDVARHILDNAQEFGFYTNLSDVGRLFKDAQFPASAGNELQKEAIFRNASGLLSVRQNLFTIIIEAQVASGGNIPRSPVRQRAVALVWRDPYTGEMFARSINWLKD